MTREEAMRLPYLTKGDLMIAFGIGKSAAYDLMKEAGASKIAGVGRVLTSERLQAYIRSNERLSKFEFKRQINEGLYISKRKRA